MAKQGLPCIISAERKWICINYFPTKVFIFCSQAFALFQWLHNMIQVNIVQIIYHFICTGTSANVIYCITCTLCKNLFTVHWQNRERTRRLTPKTRDVEKDDKNSANLVARRFNLPNHSKQHMAVCGLSLHQISTESRKTLTRTIFFFKSALLFLTVSSSTYILMGRYNHSLSFDATIMVSKNSPTIGEHVVTIFVKQ